MRTHILVQQNKIKEGHSELKKNIVHIHMATPQDYLVAGKLSKTKISLRSKSSYEFRSNFQSSLQHVKCFVYNLCNDKQKHARTCNEVKKKIPLKHINLINSVKYDDLFGPLARTIVL